MADLRNDIEKYLRGELSPAEMHALEKKALSDPFLADALEGAGQIDASEFTADLAGLQRSLNDRIERSSGKTIPLWVWAARIAAGLLIIALSTFVILNITGPDDKQDIADVHEKQLPKPSNEQAAPADSITTRGADGTKSKSDELLSLAEPEQSEPSASPARREAEADAATQGGSQPVMKPVPPIEDEKEAAPVLSIIEPAKDQPAISEEVTEERVAQATPQGYAAPPATKQDEDSYESQALKKESVKQGVSDGPTRSRAAEKKATVAKVVQGQVTSAEDGKGLPGVNVVIKGTNTGTVTDAEGYYEITSDQPANDLVFSFIGLESKEVNAGTSDKVDVQMTQDVSQLSEVVVTGYGTERTGISDDYTTLEMAAPAGGRKAFKQYLETNLRYPEQALKNNVEGKVTVQFTVESNGKLSDFKVLKGLGYGCDEEVIRLIQQGPAWSPSKRSTEPIRDRVKVRLRFSLPKK